MNHGINSKIFIILLLNFFFIFNIISRGSKGTASEGVGIKHRTKECKGRKEEEEGKKENILYFKTKLLSSREGYSSLVAANKWAESISQNTHQLNSFLPSSSYFINIIVMQTHRMHEAE